MEVHGHDIIYIKDIAKNISDLGWKLLTCLDHKEYMTILEIKELLKCNDVRLYTELRVLETALLLKRKYQESNGKKKNYYITLQGMEILKYKPTED